MFRSVFKFTVFKNHCAVGGYWIKVFFIILRYIFPYRDFKQITNSYFGNCFTFNHGYDNASRRITSKYGSRYGRFDSKALNN